MFCNNKLHTSASSYVDNLSPEIYEYMNCDTIEKKDETYETDFLLTYLNSIAYFTFLILNID